MSKSGTIGKKIKQFIGAALSLTVMAGAFYNVSEYFERPESELKYREFFNSDTEFDVLLFGNSHMLNGVFPMQLWNDYGITSYNMGGHGATLKMSYWMLRNAIDYHKPEIVVLDVYGAIWEDHEMDISHAHNSFDAFPLTPTKYQAMKEMFTGSDVMEMVFPFSVYHNRWEELFPQTDSEETETDETESADMQKSETKENSGNEENNIAASEEAEVTLNLEKGAESRIHVAAPAEFEQIPQDQVSNEITDAMTELIRMVDYCQSKEIPIVLLNIPSPQAEDGQERYNKIQEIADVEEVPYLNLPYENVVNFTTDLYDADSHLNPSGARKVTDYLGAYLTENYDLTDKRTDPEYESWNEDYDRYTQQILIPNLVKSESLNESLMLIYNEFFTADIETTEKYPLGNVSKTFLEALQDTVVMTDNLTEDRDTFRITVYDADHKEILMTKEFYHDEDGNHLAETEVPEKQEMND